jgi:PAS domain S-box-containing protein
MACLLAIAVVGIMLSMFYSQYRWLARGIVDTSVAEYGEVLAESFERRARGRLHQIADAVTLADADNNPNAVRRVLAAAVIEDPTLVGVRYVRDDDSIISSGVVANTALSGNTLWDSGQLYLSYAVTVGDNKTGRLESSYESQELQAEIEMYGNRLLEREAALRQSSLYWIGAATLVTLILCGVAIWSIAKTQSIRIRELKHQAERFSDSDFGEPLQILHSDEIGDLATVFNQMRERLQATTISRDYFDRVIAGMSEAVVITSADGVITRVNDATNRMLEYDDGELVGNSLEFIIDPEHGQMLKTVEGSSVPNESFLVNKLGKSIPVSYTGSIIDDREGAAGDHAPNVHYSM